MILSMKTITMIISEVTHVSLVLKISRPSLSPDHTWVQINIMFSSSP